MKITKEELQVIYYGLSWMDTPETAFVGYQDGVLDTVSYQLSCLIFQKHDISIPPIDIANSLEFNMSVDEIAEAVNYILDNSVSPFPE